MWRDKGRGNEVFLEIERVVAIKIRAKREGRKARFDCAGKRNRLDDENWILKTVAKNVQGHQSFVEQFEMFVAFVFKWTKKGKCSLSEAIVGSS